MDKLNLQGNSIEELTQDATNKGMYVVNQTDHSALYAEFLAVVDSSEKLCNTVDDVKTPYKSKYAARAAIDVVVNKLEATRTIASLEKDRNVMNEMNWRLAALRVRLGAISWDVEEPHNAQTELEQALDWYIPGLPAVVNETLLEADDAAGSGEKVSELSAADLVAGGMAKGKVDYATADMTQLVEVVSTAMAGVGGAAGSTSGGPGAGAGTNPNANASCPLSMSHNITYVRGGGADAIRCCNLLGILWAGRVQLKRAFYYMHTAVSLYRWMRKEGVAVQQSLNAPPPAPPATFGPALPPPPPSNIPAPAPPTSASTTSVGSPTNIAANDAIMKELESLHTHTLFYLAQAYGHVGNTVQSSLHCYQTLRRQLKGVLEGENDSSNNATVLDWCKNCQGLCDFFMATEQFDRAAYVLCVAEKVLKQKYVFLVPAEPAPASTPASAGDAAAPAPATAPAPKQHGTDDEPYYESLAKLNRRWAKLDTIVLKVAVDEASQWSGVASTFKPASTGTAAALVENVEAAMKAASLGACAGADNNIEENSTGFAPFPGITVEETPFITSDLQAYGARNTGTGESVNSIVNCYDDARRVFVRAQSRLEAAKKYYVLDGFVTDHIQLLQEHSRLFATLSLVEDDVKRRLAMALRRADMLYPLLESVGRNAFEDFHKQLSYELGEIYLSCVEWKLEKLVAKQTGRSAASAIDAAAGNLEGSDVTDLNRLKQADAITVNEYTTKALCCFAYFSKFYEKRAGSGADDDSAANASAEKEENAAATISALAGVNINTAKPIDAKGMMAFDELVRIANASASANVKKTGATAAAIVPGGSSNDCGASVVKAVGKAFCTEPDMKLLSIEEVRPFLNCHFLSARLVTKMIPLPSGGTGSGSVGAVVSPGAALTFQMEMLVESLRKYEWLHKTAIPKVLKYHNGKLKAELAVQRERDEGSSKSTADDAVQELTVRELPFEAEASIIREMVQLLPAKLDTLARNRARCM